MNLKPTPEQRILLNRHMEYYCRYYNRLLDKYRDGRRRRKKSPVSDDIKELISLREKYPQMAAVNGYVYDSAIKHFHKDRTHHEVHRKEVNHSAFDTEHASLSKNGLSMPMFKDGIKANVLYRSRDGHDVSELLDKGARIKLEKISIEKAGNKYMARVQCKAICGKPTPQERKQNSLAMM